MHKQQVAHFLLSGALQCEFVTWQPQFWLVMLPRQWTWLLRVVALHPHIVSSYELSSRPRSASLRLTRRDSRAITFPLLSCLPSQCFASCSTMVHREKSISAVTHFHKLVPLLPVITDVFFFNILFKCHLRPSQFYYLITWAQPVAWKMLP